MQFQYNRVIFLSLCTSVLFASSWNRGYPPLLVHRRTPLIPNYNRFPLKFHKQFSNQPRSRQDVLTMPQQDQMFPMYMDIPENPIYDDNYNTSETLEKPFLTEPVTHENYNDATTPEEFSSIADNKKTKDKYKNSKDKYKSIKYKGEVPPPRPFPPPLPVPDYSTVPILPMFYLVDEPNHYDYDYPYPQQEEKKKEKESKEETTTLAPFTIADVKVPAPFLRIETMICFTILGLCYGLGFLVFFQSLCVPAAKFAVALVYILLLKNGHVEPVTLEQALQQLPPT